MMSESQSALSLTRSIQNKAGKIIDTDTALVVNLNSRGGLTGREWKTISGKIMEVLGQNLEVGFARKSAEGTALCRDFLRKGFTRIIAIGGDGTMNAVANGFFENNGIHAAIDKSSSHAPSRLRPINSEAVMGIVPAGTRNVFARSLGLPEGILECCKTFASGKPRQIDIISAAVASRNQSSRPKTAVVLNAAELGAAAEVIGRSKKVRKIVKSRVVSTITGIIATIPSYQSNKCEIIINNGRNKFVQKMTMAIVANGQFLGGGFRVAPKADMFDGLLDIVIMRNSGSLKMLDELVNLKTGDYVDENNIIYIQASKVSLSSKERDVPVTIDGEPIGILPAAFEILPKALRIKI